MSQLQSEKIKDSIINLFQDTITPDNTHGEAILLAIYTVIQNHKLILKSLEQLHQKEDHRLSIGQSKPIAGKAKKPKTTTSPGKTYFKNNYVNNSEQFSDILDANAIEDLFKEFEDLLKDHTGDKLKEEQAETIWTQIISKDDDLVKSFEKLGEENNVEEPVVGAKKPAKKATKTKAVKAADGEEPKPKAKAKTKTKATKSTKATEDAEVKEKPAKTKKAPAKKKAEVVEEEVVAAAEEEEVVEEVVEEVNAEEDIVIDDAEEDDDDDEVVEEVVKKPAKKTTKKSVKVKN